MDDEEVEDLLTYVSGGAFIGSLSGSPIGASIGAVLGAVSFYIHEQEDTSPLDKEEEEEGTE